jgi:hypothetical protein
MGGATVTLGIILSIAACAAITFALAFVMPPEPHDAQASSPDYDGPSVSMMPYGVPLGGGLYLNP